MDLLLLSAQLEYKVKALVAQLLASKEQTWQGLKAQCAARLRELSDCFKGNKVRSNSTLPCPPSKSQVFLVHGPCARPCGPQ